MHGRHAHRSRSRGIRRGSQDDPVPAVVDVATEGVLQALVEANSDAFEVPATTVSREDAAASVSTASFTYGLDDPAESDPAELDPEAEAAIDDSEELLTAEGDAVDAVGIDVTNVELSLLGASSVPGEDGLTQVTMSILATRSMEGLPDWEEITYYVASVDAAAGAVVDVEVHDLAWYASHPADLAQDEAAVPAPTVAGPEYTAAALSPTGKQNVVVYANRWWNGRNPAYSTATNDCTNSISQALFYGGWTEVGDTGGGSNRASINVWWNHPGQFYDHSHSWSDAQVWREYAQGSSRVASIMTGRRSTPPTPRTTSSSCAGSTEVARSSSCGPTTTSRMCCRCRRPTSWVSSSPGCCDRR